MTWKGDIVSVAWGTVIWPETDTDRKAWELAKAEVSQGSAPMTDAILKLVTRRATEIKRELLSPSKPKPWYEDKSNPSPLVHSKTYVEEK